MTDRELLEAAAKAAGIEWDKDAEVWYQTGGVGHVRFDWNPLIDDGDALRLMVELQIDPYTYPNEADPCAATRRAIVRAAAEMAAIGAVG